MDMSVMELDDGVTKVVLDGRLDAPGADRVGVKFTAAVAAHAQDAIVDLSQVTFLASMGMRLLISTARALSQRGHSMVLFGATELVQGVLVDSALDQIIPIATTQAEALAKLDD